ncbi:GNAT family N-acetyltransferase [Labedaea rhizosphaerae]|uniref:Aminoglycoside 6'-N-acetyltransferase n=1 Tax=Labedaea rhizosphaerae TaxID=598644 RepID=A0A4R6RUK4_LABRH|nr:GNAT family protein [Labedaea rhizosphaerae]TDP89945.1 aminoglycoside 6'-N-acetyltransferase [Labedaea rhizosphaerae]
MPATKPPTTELPTTDLPTTDLRGARVVLTRATADHVPALRRILDTPAVRAYWPDVAAEDGWPVADDETVCFAVLVGGQVVGLVQYGEEHDPQYRHASIDIFLDPDVHGQGIGRDAVATLAAHLIDQRGHHRLVIDPAAGNGAAIRCYRAVGFRPVGVMRRYERDAHGEGWHDGLLMDLVAEELVRPCGS